MRPFVITKSVSGPIFTRELCLESLRVWFFLVLSYLPAGLPAMVTSGSWRTPSSSEPGVINVLGLFELSSCELSENGKLELLGAQLAVGIVNERNVIPGYRIRLLHNDTKCSSGHAIHAYFHALYFGPKIHFLIGPSQDEIAQNLARTTPYFAQLQVSAGATSPALSDRTNFRYFFRTVTPDQSHNEARRVFLNHFGWRHVAAINENQDTYALAMNQLVRTLSSQNVTFIATGSIGVTKIREQLEYFKEKDVRIILGAFSLEFAKKAFCEAFHLGLYGSRYAWFIPGSYPNFWWRSRDNDSRCSDKEMEVAIDGYFTVTTSDTLMDNRTSSAGITNEQFERLQGISQQGGSYSPQALAFDAVFALAFAMHESLPTLAEKKLRLEDFHYDNKEMALIFRTKLAELDFDGISGPIRFLGADRFGVSVFRQSCNGQMKTVALYYPEEEFLDFNCSICELVSWMAAGARIPADRRVVRRMIEIVEPEVFYSVSAVALLGIFVACSFLWFNFLFRSQKFIKLSSPKLNNTTALGCCLVYASVISLGVDYGITGDIAVMKPVCQLVIMVTTHSLFGLTKPRRGGCKKPRVVRIFLFAAGFSVAFGSLFLKTFRVHQIFRKASRGVIKSKLLRDNQLLCGVGGLFFVDCVFLFIWFLSDPIHVDLRQLTEQHIADNPDIVLQREVEVCSSDYMNTLWLPSLYLYKGLMLLAGIFLTFETRHVKIPALNDSQAVGLSIYNVVICSVIAFALTQIIVEHHTLRFVLVSALTIATTTGTLCFLFLPKMMVIMKNMGDDPILSGSGLKVECNTRRLAVEDPKERFVRAEIQNRVYQRDIADLDTELQKLTFQAELPVIPRIKISSSLLLSLPEYFVDDDHTVERYMQERERVSPNERIQTLRSLLPLLKRNRLDVSSSLSDRSDVAAENSDDRSTTMVMETQDGNVTLLVKKNKQAAPQPAGMVKFRKAMVRYKFIAIKPPVKRPEPSTKNNGYRQENSATDASTSDNV